MTTTYDVAGTSYAPVALPFVSKYWSPGNPCFATNAFTRSGVWFTDTATPTNFTCVPVLLRRGEQGRLELLAVRTPRRPELDDGRRLADVLRQVGVLSVERIDLR